MALSELKLKNLKPKDIPYRVPDSNGLTAKVLTSGNIKWHYRYHIYQADKRIERTYIIGDYPNLSLKQARAEHSLLRADVLKGIDVWEVNNQQKKEKPIVKSSFGEVAKEWLEIRKSQTQVDDTWKREWTHLERFVLPKFQDTAIKDIKPVHIDNLLQRVKRIISIYTAKKVCWTIGKVFDRAYLLGKVPVNIMTSSMAKGLGKHDTKSYESIKKTETLGRWVFMTENHSSSKDILGCYVRLIAHFGQRPGEIRDMKWSEIDFKKREWTWEVSKTKRYGIKEFRVYLSDQVIEILKDAQKLSGDKEYVFWSYGKDNRISHKGVEYRMDALGFTKDIVVPHGFRTTFQSLGQDVLGAEFRVVDLCLAHKPQGTVYNLATFWKERVQHYQDWSDLLMKLKAEYQRTQIKILK